MAQLPGGGAPLRGRARLELVVRPFSFRESAEFWEVVLALHREQRGGDFDHTAGKRSQAATATPYWCHQALPLLLGRFVGHGGGQGGAQYPARPVSIAWDYPR